MVVFGFQGFYETNDLRRTPQAGGGAAREGKSGQTLQATALVQDAYMRLVDISAGTGTAAGTSSPLPPKRCAGFWSITSSAVYRGLIFDGV